MSKKYVPSFLKDQATATTPAPAVQENTTRSFGQKTLAPLSASNKFAPLADDYPKSKPIVNTSLPAQQAPKLVPMTLASATSNGAVPMTSEASGSGPKKSFASKFAEQVKIANDPNYKPPPKPVNFSSEDDFPSLGAKKPVANTVIPASSSSGSLASIPKSSSGQSFADLAKGWAKKKEDEAEEERLKAVRDEERRRENALFTGGFIGMRFGRNRQDEYDSDEEDDYNNRYGDDNLLDDDSYEANDEDGEPSTDEDDEENGEFNQNVGWDGRRKDDLY
jgi:hypothetical protein